MHTCVCNMHTVVVSTRTWTTSSYMMYLAIHATLVYNIRRTCILRARSTLEYVRVCIVTNNVCMNTLVLLLASMNTLARVE